MTTKRAMEIMGAMLACMEMQFDTTSEVRCDGNCENCSLRQAVWPEELLESMRVVMGIMIEETKKEEEQEPNNSLKEWQKQPYLMNI